ncbi:hypothetical protein BBF96_02750 [Anoxybacter fermentans]|uniref:MurNAc-LAA domain-containing protein n=1 Tax=Anoxybacter fermentans TaxID=1323375 RepID=A0A3S9SVU8_9FIRM|nr:N-acetylmuramoyl-L-alanine amidase [Anoxybacter fermentans]AZR72405.1 hypothetical protein BBF96_02750 [Anoxybacter fermentans]
MQVLFIFIKKKHLLIGLIIIFIFSIGMGFTANLTRLVFYSKLHKIVVIDAGHGSFDPGAYYKGLKEKDINLQVAFILKKLLENSNIEVVMTRTDDSLYNQNRREDIIYRVRKTNEVNADAFISIHVNKFPTSEPFGGQAYYYAGQESKLLAEKIQEQLKAIQPDNYRSVGRGNYYVLKHTKCPAVIVEIGFISNPIDRKRITDPEEQLRIAKAIRNGLIAFFHHQFEANKEQIKRIENNNNHESTNLSDSLELYFAKTTKNGEILLPVHIPLLKEKVLAVSTANKHLTILELIAIEAINQLIKGPENPNLAPVIPPGTVLKSIQINHGLAILNFNHKLVENHWGGAEGEQLTVESIVKTLTTLPGIERVQILVEGESGQTIAGHIIFDQPFTKEMFE